MWQWYETNCHNDIPEETKNKQIIENNTYIMPMILELVKETTGDNSVTSFSYPTFYDDSNFEEQDPSSLAEIKRIMAWVHSL